MGFFEQESTFVVCRTKNSTISWDSGGPDRSFYIASTELQTFVSPPEFTVKDTSPKITCRFSVYKLSIETLKL